MTDGGAAPGSPADDRTRVLVVVEQLRRKAPGGIGTYARGLLQGMRQRGPEHSPEVELLASRAGRAGRCDTGPTDGGRGDPLAGLGFPLRTSVLPGPALTRGWDLGVLRAPSGFDVVHTVSLATMDPGGAALVATVHDLLWRHVPEAYPPRGRAWHEAALHRALRRADLFVVPAEAVADDLAAAGAPSDAIRIIPMGGDHLPPPDLAAAAALLGRLGVGETPFLLSVGTLEPRKNLARLTQAYGSIRGSLPGPWPLVVVGPDGWGERLVASPGVVMAGAVTTGELSALYTLATLLAYVPLVEGFGLPPVEAMVHGTPVVASPLPSTGDAAYEVDPRDTASIAEGLMAVATDPEVRTRLRTAGLSHAAGATWASVAARYQAVWREVATGGGRRGR